MKELIYFLPLIFIVSCTPRQVGPPVPPVQPTPAPITRLEGKWREIRNQRKPVREKRAWVFRGNTIEIDDGKDRYTGTFTINEEADPHEIDFHFEDYPVNRGVYSLKGDTLTLKLLETVAERPLNLRYESGYTLITCVREKE